MFLVILLIRNNSLISTEVYRKNINSDIYKNWKSFATDGYLKEELEHTQTFFHHRSNYPLWVTNKVIDDAKKFPSADENDSSR